MSAPKAVPTPAAEPVNPRLQAAYARRSAAAQGAAAPVPPAPVAAPIPDADSSLPGGEEDADELALAAALGIEEAPKAQTQTQVPAPPPAPPVAAEPPRSTLDESVLSVLREEAEREAEARRLEAQRAASRRSEAESQLQVQPDLGMGDPVADQGAAQRRLAMLKGQDPDALDEATRLPARRDLLPDVEEINSTLRPDSIARDLEDEVDALPDLTRGSAFRTGFVLVILILALGTAVYLVADRIAEMAPSLEPGLKEFVGFIDGIRLWLNDSMDSATRRLGGEG